MQKSLSFSKGITTSPSDLLSDDSELTASRDLIFRNGEMQPLRQAATFGQTDHKLLYIHKGADYTNAITYDGTNLYWGALKSVDGRIPDKKPLYDIGNVSDITSVGNTLVVATDKGIHYILYKEGKYIDLGTELPRPEFRFWLESKSLSNPIKKSDYISFQDYMKTDTCQAFYTSNNELCKIEYVTSGRDDSSSVGKSSKTISSGTPDTSKTLTYRGYCARQSKTSEINTASNALVALHLAEVKKENLFAFPFFVRFALRLYDGSYTRISPPVLCLPSIHNNVALMPMGANDSPSTQQVGYFVPSVSQASLWFKAFVNEADKWSDIIKDCVIFASDEEMQFNIDGDWYFYQPHELMNAYIYDCIVGDAYSCFGKWSYKITHSSSFSSQTDGYLTSVIMPAKMKTEEQIIENLSKKGVFYKLLEFPFSSINKYENGIETTKLINDNVVTNLTEQEQLGVDDYMGWTTISASKLYAYNSRINALGIKRKPYSGFNHFVAVKPTTSEPLSYYVSLSKTAGEVWIKGSMFCDVRSALLSWFFYPDPNAKEVLFYDESTQKGISAQLQNHPRLNGAYLMKKLPDGTLPVLTNISKPVVNEDYFELLDSQIFTSVVNNPFVFQASGDNTVGTGSILGIAANTEPISQGQFGQYPLIVFTTEGIYGLSVNSEGLYSASYPISREVCNNPESITPTGNVVYFTSDKGLMAVSGGTVRCVSPQLSGANPPYSDATDSFLTFVRKAFLAYDYRDSLLFIYNVSYDYAYVYNLLDGTFATISLGNRIWRAVSNYPDTLLQDAENNVYSFSKIPVAQDDTQTYSGTFTTRPLKLGSSIQLKTIHQIVHLFNSADGSLTLNVYASNDCRNWTELHSLHGKPWKYYRFRYNLSNISASDTFAGTVIDFTPRFTNKIR